jgi:hypothetical protein
MGVTVKVYQVMDGSFLGDSEAARALRAEMEPSPSSAKELERV